MHVNCLYTHKFHSWASHGRGIGSLSVAIHVSTQFVLFTRALLPSIFVFPEQLTYLYVLYPFHLSESRFKQKLIVQPFTKQCYAPYTPLASAFMVSFPSSCMWRHESLGMRLLHFAVCTTKLIVPRVLSCVSYLDSIIQKCVCVEGGRGERQGNFIFPSFLLEDSQWILQTRWLNWAVVT